MAFTTIMNVLRKVKTMQLITLDFETYFSTEYGLGKMTTEEYVRDPRFKVHCAGQKCDGYSTDVLWPGYLEGAQPFAGYQYEAVLCHHAHFDGLILSHHYGIRPAFWFDTLSMARLVFPHAKSHSLGALAKMLGLEEKTVPYESFKASVTCRLICITAWPMAALKTWS